MVPCLKDVILTKMDKTYAESGIIDQVFMMYVYPCIVQCTLSQMLWYYYSIY